MMNGSWDVLEVVFMWFYWVETSGKTLEEIDAVLDGGKHSGAPDLEDVRRGKFDVEDLGRNEPDIVEVTLEKGAGMQ